MDKIHWLLPEGIDEVLPPQAWALETMRRRLLDLYHSWGYELVIPPFVEYLDSLLMGAGGDVDLQTFKLTDQVSGRQLGIRADMTTQVARIDAHHLDTDAPARLCYMGTVLHARPDGFGGTRAPLQIGAELYGHAGYHSDCEVISLMLETLSLAGIETVSMDLGHVQIFRGLAGQAGLSDRQEAVLFEALQRKAVTEIHALLDEFSTDAGVAEKILALSDLNGSDVIGPARDILAGSPGSVLAALDEIEQVAKCIGREYPQLPLHFDLAELRGYNFHTGIVFSAYVPESGVEIARGGRYDNIGGEFGRSRPATGFSTDLKSLISHIAFRPAEQEAPVYAPALPDDAGERSTLLKAIAGLRQQGRRVIIALPGQSGNAQDIGCRQQLILDNGQWLLSEL